MKRFPRPEDWKTTKPDEDKILRLVLDGLETVVYPHDAQVASQSFIKTVAPQGIPAKTIVLVSSLQPFQAFGRPNLEEIALALGAEP